ncbi:hypothetical protein KAM448_05590 [Aeromonas caviae]|uniref:Uncharacterized protein n=2 Tax=Aeromonas caviae TaxID=648 RepID=A0ABD0B940_AERCA|nr:hypothetical protein [Aeromonas caviae]BCR29911.1 hypothetical protein KAM376_29170 [Aeromonas caviae]GJA81018.1 hypothetical protein KAM355_15780 [Aeromonas caviae]GJA98465.1 hypothetical protein KAM359_18730 [Aeromonas caviae]GJB10773.1 hypothetical protein KAM362_13330 [Aeromonas caviae]GJB23389.1 hypothetical protein KAM365_11390 [Aeromonas caviae]
MSTSEVFTVQIQPGMTINLDNESKVPQRYQIDFGEYGVITFEALPGAEVKIENVHAAPKITILETGYTPGVKR